MLLLVVGVAVAGCLVTRQVVEDQEHKLLQQRAEEAGLYLSSVVSSVQTELASLAASAAATHKRPAAFEKSTQLLTSVPGGFTSVALVTSMDPISVIASTGSGLEDGLGPVRTSTIRSAVSSVGLTGALVASPIITTGTTRSLGFAYASPTLPGAVVYAESKLESTSSTATTESQPFSELTVAVYATPQADREQLVVVSGADEKDLPLDGRTVSVMSNIGQGDPWLLVTRARHSLVGSVATAMPWAILAAGLLVALLATGIVETMARRREYALGLVAVRTQELERSLVDLAAAHEQLVRQERLAAIGQLASTIGHELRNPLGVISNAIYLLRADFGTNPGQPAERHLATAEREISAATVIVSDLLEFARQRQPVVDQVDLSGLLDEVIAVLPPPQGVTVERGDMATATVRADRDMLRQVLINLIGNAYQAMPEGGVMTVESRPTDGAVEIAVRDTGAGMNAEVRGRLFEPFFTTKARGVGLGLAVTRRIVEAHGGDIVVESEEGRGSEFRVVLPALVGARAPDVIELSDVHEVRP